MAQIIEVSHCYGNILGGLEMLYNQGLFCNTMICGAETGHFGLILVQFDSL